MPMVVSIIIPVYNVERYIKRCLESIIAQDCKLFCIECILVDDCSTDRSLEIISEVLAAYIGENISFVIKHHEVNKGLSAARNTGIMASTGDYLYFMDSDDRLINDSLKYLVAASIDYPNAEIIMGNSLCVGINFRTNTPILFDNTKLRLFSDKKEMWKMLFSQKLDRHAWNKLVRRTAVLHNELFFVEGIIYEDVLWTYELIGSTSSIMVISDMIYIYESNEDSIIHTISQRSDLLIKSLTYLCQYIQKNPPSVDNSDKLSVAHILFLYHWLIILEEAVAKYGTTDVKKQCISDIKKEILSDVFEHRSFFLYIFLLTIFAPFLLKFKIYRSNLNRIEKIAYRLFVGH